MDFIFDFNFELSSARVWWVDPAELSVGQTKVLKGLDIYC